MKNLELLFDAAWKVLAVGLVLGAGLPALFAVGIKSMAYGVGGSAEIDSAATPHPVGRVVGILCFAVVAAAILTGITIIVASGFGKAVDFSHVYPTIVDKKH
ncbi:hypothetical protein [Arsenicicoccus dermatophilus]|uniref:hypothetical protein n=1 Tax=Arsenicicoccus dermatophilus TaxID=1076331 RepID=UPI001F4C5DAF|nr:hypothetical protein [Arsenicicoccus dermatophilus]MCH8611836.1 hypothetical protein [Arsenicicoccus dermatophilus]